MTWQRRIQTWPTFLAVLTSLWVLSPAASAQERPPAPSPIQGLAVAPDGQTIAAACKDGSVRLWNVADGKLTLRLTVFQPHPLQAVAFSADGKALLTGGEQGHVAYWVKEGAAYAQRWQRKVKVGQAAGVAFSPDGKWATVVCGFGCYIHFLDPASGVIRRTLWETGNGVSCVAFLPDGKLLATGGQTFHFWDLAAADLRHDHVEKQDFTRDELTQIEKRTSRFGGLSSWTVSISVAPDGKNVAAGGVFSREDAGAPKSVVLIDPATGTIRRRLAQGPSRVTCVAFSSDGTLLAASGEDNRVRVWDAATGNLVRTFTAKHGNIRSMVSLPGGSHIALAGDAGMVEIWDSRAGTLQKVLGKE